MQIMDTVNILGNYLSSYSLIIRRMDKKDVVFLSTEFLLFLQELYLL